LTLYVPRFSISRIQYSTEIKSCQVPKQNRKIKQKIGKRKNKKSNKEKNTLPLSDREQKTYRGKTSKIGKKQRKMLITGKIQEKKERKENRETQRKDTETYRKTKWYCVFSFWYMVHFFL